MPLSITQSWGTLPNPFNYSEIVAFVQSSTLNFTGTAGTTDIADGSVTSAKVKPGPYFYAAGTRSGAAPNEIYAVTLSPAATALTAGLWFYFKADLANNGAVQVNVNALGATYIKKWNGADLQTGDIIAGTILLVIYDGTSFLLCSPVARPTRIYCGTAGGTANAITITATPSTLTQPDFVGREIEFTALSTNTDAVTLQFTTPALAPQPIKKGATSALVAGDIVAGQVMRVVWDGTNYQMVTPASSVSTRSGLRAHHRNLRISYATANTVTVSADEIVLTTSTGTEFTVVRNVSLSLDNSTTGANGRDTGSETADAWYYIWVVSDGSSTKGVLSLQNDYGGGLPTVTGTGLGTPYRFFGQVGAIRNTGGNFVEMDQRDNRVAITPVDIAYGTAAWGDQDVSVYVPLLAKTIFGSAGSTSASARMRIAHRTTLGSFLGITDIVAGAATATTNSMSASGHFSVLNTGTAGSSFAAWSDNANGRITISGYEW